MTDLILLMGTNPLTDYMVAIFFMQQRCELQRIWLVASASRSQSRIRGSEPIARDLMTVLEKRIDKGLHCGKPAVKLCLLEDATRADSVEQAIEQQIIRYLQEASEEWHVHLNYTGGTKVMASHSCRVIRASCSGCCSFSYLDRRTFKLWSEEPEQVLSQDLRQQAAIAIDELFMLHGMEHLGDRPDACLDQFARLPEQQRWPIYHAMLAMSQLHFPVNSEARGNTRRRTVIKDGIDLYKFWNRHSERSGLWEPGGLPAQLANPAGLRKQWDILVGSHSGVRQLMNCLPGEGAPPMDLNLWQNFVDGRWLEAYTKDLVVRELARCKELKSRREIVVEGNVEARVESTKIKKMEIDLIVLNGCQLCGISCANAAGDDQATLKNKAFEILHRTHQLGGDEARAVLVSRIKNEMPEFESDLWELGDFINRRLLVIGNEDLEPRRFWSKLSAHIFGA